jgi:hypothetical protein
VIEEFCGRRDGLALNPIPTEALMELLESEADLDQYAWIWIPGFMASRCFAAPVSRWCGSMLPCGGRSGASRGCGRPLPTSSVMYFSTRRYGASRE